MSRRAGRLTAMLVSVGVAVLLAWLVGGAFAPGGDTRLAVGVAAVAGLVSAFAAGTIVEALVVTIFVASSAIGALYALGRVGADATTLRTVVISLSAGVGAGQLVTAVYNDFLAPPG